MKKMQNYIVKDNRIFVGLEDSNLEQNDCKSCHVPDRELRKDRQISRTLDKDTTAEFGTGAVMVNPVRMESHQGRS